jgi:hypothetical protein
LGEVSISVKKSLGTYKETDVKEVHIEKPAEKKEGL